MTTAMEAVADATADLARVFPVNQVVGDDGKPKTKPTYPYATYSASLGRGDSYMLDAAEGVRWGRVVVQVFGETADSTDSKYEAIRDALVGVSLPITGYDTTSCRAELDPTPLTRDPDDNGVVGVTATFTFTATKES